MALPVPTGPSHSKHIGINVVYLVTKPQTPSMNPSKRPVMFTVGYEALLLLCFIISLYFSLFVCLQSTVKAVVYEAPFQCTLVEKASQGSRQCSWHQAALISFAQMILYKVLPLLASSSPLFSHATGWNS